MRSGGPSPLCPRFGLLSFLPPSLSPLSPAARPHSKVARHLLPSAATSSTMTSWSAAGSATGNGTWSASARTAAGGAALPVGLAGQPQVVTAHSSAALLPPHLDSPHRIYAAEPCCPHQPGHAASPCRRVECKVDPPSAGDKVEFTCNVVNGQVDIPSCGAVNVPSNADCSKPLVEEILTAWRPFD
jgi:hypothetical protein